MKGWKKTLIDCLLAAVIGLAFAWISRSAEAPEWFARSFGGLVYLIAYFHFEGKE